ncbi:MAG TPA: hypothetical protein VGD56_00005 [Gemmatirosa sp.]
MATLDATATEALLYRPAANQSLHGFNVGGYFIDAPHLPDRPWVACSAGSPRAACGCR